MRNKRRSEEASDSTQHNLISDHCHTSHRSEQSFYLGRNRGRKSVGFLPLVGQRRNGEYCTARAHAMETQKLSQLSANLYHEATALWINTTSLISQGNFKQSADQLQRSRVMLGVCSLADGNLDREIAIVQGEMYLQKSEYAEARNLYNQILETDSPEQNSCYYTLSLLNIAHIATICGDTRSVSHNLNQAKYISSTSMVRDPT
jgi:tetratricopeptide (TPR) repeat protein